MDKRIPLNGLPLKEYHLQTRKAIKPVHVDHVGTAYTVDKDNFAALADVTVYSLELWEACMRLPHWHPNAAELGYVISGSIEIIIWRSPGETAVFTLGPGMCWFIPKAALHSLNNVGSGQAQLLVGFSVERPQDIDLPVAFNGIPIPIRDTYTAAHAALRQWQGNTENPLIGRCPVLPALQEITTGSPYGFDLAKVTPLFKDENLGSVTWGIQCNWRILEEISMLRAHLKPGVARDPIWYPDAGTLYVVSRGNGEFTIIIATGETPTPFKVILGDYVYVPTGVLHTFCNTSASEDFEVIAFFTQANPQPEVSLAVATGFFPNTVRKAAMTQYGAENKVGDPLKELRLNKVSPYLLRIKRE
ncbi:MAG TPA: cupin domain-containing protein [Gammaproteobacteria bacterium]|jgi:oxalate decarboxylase|nr:cupin domain-containing protein [Gammaproteobacteria bacterium]